MGSITVKGGTSKGTVFLVDTSSSSYKKGVVPTITVNGKTYTGKLINVVEEHAGTPIAQYGFPGLPSGANGTVEYGGDKQDVNTGGRFSGQGVGSLQGGGSAGGGGGFPGQPGLGPVPYGNGALPAYLGGQFPQFQPVQYNPLAVPNYTQFDPSIYAQKYSPVIRSEMLKNFNFSQGLAFNTLADELKGLKAYAPAAAGLARGIAAVDTQQNQALRTDQLGRTLPDVLGGLKKQTSDAAAYASGHLPNSFDDSALEVGIRSNAADIATSRGFGVTSNAARNLSDYMNTKERLSIAQYGNQLEQSNAQIRSNLEVAPTEYISAGQGINPNPSLSPSQLIGSYFGASNQLGTIPATTALQSSIGQSQFQTNLVKDVGMFNTSNQLNTDMYNHSNIFAAQQGFFNYNNSYATNAANLATATIQQNLQKSIFDQTMSAAQKSQTIQSILGALGVAPKLIDSINSIINGNSGGSTGNPSIDQYPSVIDPNAILNPYNPNPYGAGSSILGTGSDGSTTSNIPDYGYNYGLDYATLNYDLRIP